MPVTAKAQESAEYADYLDRAGEDNNLHYDVKIKASRLLLSHTEDTFVTPVFIGSASLRDAAGQMIENVTKSVRRKEKVNDKYLEKMFSNITSLYRLEQNVSSQEEQKDLGPLPGASVLLLAAIVSAWVCIGIFMLYSLIKSGKSKKK